MKDFKVVVLGDEDFTKSEFVKNLTENSVKIDFKGLSSGIDIGYTLVKGKRVIVFGARTKEKDRFLEEVLPAGIDLGIVMVDPWRGVSEDEKGTIKKLKELNMNFLVFMNENRGSEIHMFGNNIVQGSAVSTLSAHRLLNSIVKKAT